MTWSHPSLLFLTFGFSMMGGILCAEIFPGQFLTFFAVLLACGVFFFFLGKTLRPHIFLAIFGLILGFLSTEYTGRIHENRGNELANLTGNYSGTHLIEGEITALQGRNENMLRYRLLLEQIDGKIVSDSIHIFVSIPENLTLAPGDRMKFSGKIRALEPNETFDYQKYGWLQRVYGQTSTYQFTRIESHEGSLRVMLAHIRSSLVSQIRFLFPPGSDALALGMIIGDTHFFTEEMSTNFSRSSLSHLVAVSGSNIALVIVFFSILLRYFPIKKIARVTLIVSGVIFYCLIVGWNIPAIRAGFMGIIGYFVLVSGKKISIIPFLLLTALIFLVREPLTLVSDVSFQLSFIAVWGLIVFHDPIDRMLRWIPNTLLLRDALVVILSASLITMPIIFANFGTIAFFGIFANLIVAPFIAIGTILGIVSVGFSYISPLLGHIFGYIPFSVFTLILTVSEWIGSDSGAVLTLENITPYDSLILIFTLFFVTWMSFEYVHDTRATER